MKSAVLWLLHAALAVGLWAEVKLPALLSDGMVLQRDLPVHVWGRADPGEDVRVEFRGQLAVAETDAEGRWEVYLKPVAAGGPFTLTVRGNNEVAIADVQVGEVWVASGQSNMVWPIQRSHDAEKEIAAANYPGIRYFKAELSTADERQEDIRGAWRKVSPATAGEFSAVAYFFARHLHQRMDVPFGIIQSAWGGTPAEAWTSGGTLLQDPALAPLVADYDRQAAEAKPAYEAARRDWEQRAAAARAAGEEAPRQPVPPRALRPQHQPAALFNAMVAPLLPYPIRGAIWYQGENNASRGQGVLYRRLFPALIQDWRREWGVGPFPFLFVQLANYGRVGEDATWAELREAQAMALDLVGTGMAVTIDIGNPTDIHPRNKQDVGLRLALAARAKVYGESNLHHSGPIFRQASWEGSAVRLWFDHLGGGLKARGGPLEGFEVADADGEFVAADARIAGETVMVSSPAIPAPRKVRYAWAADPQGNLFNEAGLPASPFRAER